MKPGLFIVIAFEPPDIEDSELTGTEPIAVVKMPGGENVPLISTPPGMGTLTPPTRIEYSVLGSNPLTLN